MVPPTAGPSMVSQPKTARLFHLAGSAALAAWLTLAFESAQPTGASPGFLMAVLVVAWAGTLAAFRTASKTPRAVGKRAIVAWAILFRLCGLLGEPVLEDDQYRYLWDGWRFAQSGSPYGQVPADFFQDSAVPEKFQEILGRINHPDLPTIYGPVTQLLFLAGYFMQPGETLPIRALLSVVELLGLLGLARMTSPAGFLLYAWCPLLIQETAFTGHPDALGVALLLAALALRARGSLDAAALALALAAGSRLQVLPLVPFVLWNPGRSLRSAAVFGLGSAAMHLPFLVGSGLGSGLPAFASNWEFNSLGFGVLAALTGDAAARVAAPLLALAGLAWLFDRWRNRPDDPVPGDLAMGTVLFWSPVINPWYLLWLAPFVAARPSAWGIAALALVPLSYFHGLYLPGWELPPYHHPAWVRILEWGTVLLLLGVALIIRHQASRMLQPPRALRTQRKPLIYREIHKI